MDPLSLCLLSISSSSVAIRRICAAMARERSAPADYLAERIGDRARTSPLQELAAATVRPRRLVPEESAPMLYRLSRFALTHDLMVCGQVALEALFEIGGGARGAEALRGRRIDIVLCDREGVPLCGIELTAAGGGPSFRDHLRAQTFRQGFLQLLALPADADWAEVRDRLEAMLWPELPIPAQANLAGEPAREHAVPA